MQSFDDFQREYTSDGEKSCLTLTIPVEEQIKQYQIGMLEKNRLDSLLPLVVQRVNDEWKLSYDITSKIPLTRLLERRSLQHHDFEFIISQFAAMVHGLKEYLLDLSSMVLDENYIYCDPADFKLSFIYIPIKTSEKEPERIKSFLKKLIVEDIRLVEDVSGTLLKKLLEALKSETFTSELLYQCISNVGSNTAKDMLRTTDDTIEEIKVDRNERAAFKSHIPGTQAGTQIKPDKLLNKSKHENYINTREPTNYPIPHSKRESPAPSVTGNPQNIPSGAYGKKGVNQNTGNNLTAFLQKYPKPSWFIAGGVNLVLFIVLICIIATSGKNPGNAVSNIAGFLLIAAAGNYFLITRLFSKDKCIPVSEKPAIPARNATFIKRFGNDNCDEDIILPRNPGVRFRSEANREKDELPFFSNPTVSSSGRAAFDDCKPAEDRNPEYDRELKLKAQQNETTQGQDVFYEPGIKQEANKVVTQTSQAQDDDRKTEGQGTYSKNIADIQNNIIPQAAESITETVRPKANSDVSHDAFQTSGVRKSKNQSFPDKTMVLGRPSRQTPSLVSLSRSYEKILLDRTSILIGRLADSVDYVIQNRAVGKIHAEIKKTGEQYFIIDLNSVNGTYVNGERLICNTEIPVNNGDKVTFANESYTFTA